MAKNTINKLNLLYISHHREATGWGQAARDYILALDAVGINVVPRAIRLGSPINTLPERLLKLENKSVSGCDICVQHVLPNYMKYDSTFKKNIGLFVLETKNIEHTTWVDHLNLLDELWVPCTDMQYINGINKPIRVIPHTFDLNKYNREYNTLNIEQVRNKFTFYFIGEFGVRKHIAALLRAFHTEFSPEEPVELVLKLNKPGVEPEQLAKDVVEFCNKIKENLQIYKDLRRYKSEIIITVRLSEDDIMSLHKTCDCFVNPSHGDAWNIPLWESMAMGNIAISTAVGGPKDYIDSSRNGFLVSGSLEPVFGQRETVQEFGSSLESWFNVSISDLMKTMRRVYNLSQDKKNKIKMEAKSSSAQYSYDIIGRKMIEAINA